MVPGDSLTFKAKVTENNSPTAVTQGSVKFGEGNNCLGGFTNQFANVALNSSGEASATTTNLSLGSHEIRACYSGSGSGSSAINASSGSLTQTVNPRPPTNLTATANGQNTIELSWTASPDSANISNYVLREGSTVVSTIPKNATSNSVGGLAAGSTHTYTLVARYTVTTTSPSTTTNFDSTAATASATTAPACTTPAAPVFDTKSSDATGSNGWFKGTAPTILATSTSSSATITYATEVNGGTKSAYSATAPTLGQGTTKVYAKATNGTCPTSETTDTFKVDTIAPSINDDGTTQTANGAGWFNTAVTNDFSASDATSSLADASKADFSVSSGTNEGTAVKINSGPVSDNAGNTNSGIDSAAYKIDKTAPVVAYKSASPAANANGWRNVDVTATFEATDSLSGMGATDADKTATDTATTTGEGTNVTVDSPAFTDRAGDPVAANAATSPGFKIDKTAPVVAYKSASPAANANGWRNVDVTATFEATDSLSGIGCNRRRQDGHRYGHNQRRGYERTVDSPAFTDRAGNPVAANAATQPRLQDRQDRPSGGLQERLSGGQCQRLAQRRCDGNLRGDGLRSQGWARPTPTDGHRHGHNQWRGC